MYMLFVAPTEFGIVWLTVLERRGNYRYPNRINFSNLYNLSIKILVVELRFYIYTKSNWQKYEQFIIFFNLELDKLAIQIFFKSELIFSKLYSMNV